MIDLDENKTPEAIIAEAMVGAGAPLMHSRVEEAVAGALRKAGMLAEQSGQVCAWCPSPARGSAYHNDGKLHPSCGQTNHGQGWVPDYPVERIGAIEAERDAALARIAELEAALVELAPSAAIIPGAEVVIDGDVFAWKDLPSALSNTRASLGEVTRDAKAWCIRAEQAEARIAEAAKLHRSIRWAIGNETSVICVHDETRWPCSTAVALGLNEGENDD